ncbi:MAG: response regulator [Deltaproteobacteria bacterium]|nr:response regulator [Deltaproteobacteria bacterium]
MSKNLQKKQKARRSEDQKIHESTSAESMAQFLAKMSHEIRNPLNIIVGATEILRESAISEEHQKYVDILDQASNNLLSLINDVLDISKIEAGQTELDLTEVCLAELLESISHMLALKAEKKKTTLLTQIDRQCPAFIITDKLKLKQILSNLLSNAIKFTENGHISVRVRRQAEGLEFCVEDTGIGIPQEAQKSIFESYKQASPQTGSQFGGTGLGLAIVQSLTTLLGGKVWLKSAPGKGSSFFFTLPLKMIPEKISAKQCSDISHQLSEKNEYKPLLLVIEDEEDLLDVFADIFNDQNIELQLTSNPEFALQEIKNRSFDAILSDFHMPSMTGLELLKKIRKQHIETPFILMTGDSSKQLIIEGFRAGVMDLIEKPFEESELVSIVWKSIRKGKKLKELRQLAIKEKKLPALNILIAEDSQENQFLLKTFLRNSPCKLNFCNNGQEAIESFRNSVSDLIIMDIEMPVLNGYEATKEIRKIETQEMRKPSYIVALSAHALQSEVNKALEAGCDHYITKPVKKSILIDLIAEFYDRSEKH